MAKKPKKPPKRKKQTAAQAKRQARKQQSKAARKQQRQKQQQYRQSAKAKKQSSFSSRVSGLFDSFSGSGIGQSALFADKPKPKKKVSNPILDIQKEIKKEKEKAERAKKVKLGKGTKKLDSTQYKRQRLENIKSKTDGRMNGIVNKHNELADDADRAISKLPNEIQQKLPALPQLGRHIEIDEFYAYSYEDEMIPKALTSLEDLFANVQSIQDTLISILPDYPQYKNEIQDAIDDLDSALANVRQSGVMKNVFTTPEQISAHYRDLSKKQMQAAKDLGLDVD